MTTVTLPWPSRHLSPHANGHWWSRSSATRKARRDAFYAARNAGVATDPNAVLRVAYNPPDRRRRDVQNMPAMIKAYIDGIADAMGCDDNGFRVQFPDSFGDVVKGGEIVIEVTEG